MRKAVSSSQETRGAASLLRLPHPSHLRLLHRHHSELSYGALPRVYRVPQRCDYGLIGEHEQDTLAQPEVAFWIQARRLRL